MSNPAGPGHRVKPAARATPPRLSDARSPRELLRSSRAGKPLPRSLRVDPAPLMRPPRLTTSGEGNEKRLVQPRTTAAGRTLDASLNSP
jgi:hypothetical protein